MSLLESALQLLKRPVETAGEPQGHRKTTGPTDPLTEAELVGALSRLAGERHEAETTLASAAERREALLMTPDSDAQIHGLAQAISQASLVLERLDRLQPDLQQRLGEVRYYNRGARWIADRDIAATGFEKFTAAISAYETAQNEWWAVWQGLRARWPTATEIMPRMPALDGGSAAYTRNLDTFRCRVIVLSKPPKPAYYILQEAINFSRKTGHPPEDIPPGWIEECLAAIADKAVVRWVVSTLDSEGRTIEKGAVRQLTYDEAAKAVRSGRAVYCDG